MKNIKATNRGFTLIEMLIAITLMVILSGACLSLFVTALHGWDSSYVRSSIREDINYAMAKTVRDLKGIAPLSLVQYNSIAHTIQYDDLDGNSYVIYPYNRADESFDSAYDESLYDLRKASKTQLDAGNYDAGVLILRDMVSPDTAEQATALTIDSNQVTLDILIQRTDETVRVRTKVRPRNL